MARKEAEREQHRLRTGGKPRDRDSEDTQSRQRPPKSKDHDDDDDDDEEKKGGKDGLGKEWEQTRQHIRRSLEIRKSGHYDTGNDDEYEDDDAEWFRQEVGEEPSAGC